MRLPALSLLTLSLLACAPATVPPTSLPFFGDGYPASGDACRRLGESAQTVDYLDHTADLVGCPDTMPGLNDFVAQTGAREVFRQDGYVVYSVPHDG